MTGADWVLLAIIGTGGLIGLRRGVLTGILDLIALGIGVSAAVVAAPWIDDRLVGMGIEQRGLLIGLAVAVFGATSAVAAAILKIVASPLGLARKVPPFGLVDSLLGIGPGLVKGTAVAVVVVLVLLIQFPSTTYGERVRSSTIGEFLADASSAGFERGADLIGADLHGLTARKVGPGQSAAGSSAVPGGDLDADSAAEADARRLINEARRADGIPSLEGDQGLSRIAQEHAAGVRRLVDGRLPANAADVGDRLSAAGENCFAVGAVLGTGDSVADIVDALLRSPEHREVLLSGTYVRVGIGVLTGIGGEAILVGVFTL